MHKVQELEPGKGIEPVGQELHVTDADALLDE
jgi:hypothetical protein